MPIVVICVFVGGIPGQQKVALRLKAQTSRIVSSFKTSTVSCSLVKEFSGHKDGVWDVTSCRLGIPIIGTAGAGKLMIILLLINLDTYPKFLLNMKSLNSTDHKAGVWAVDSGRCLLRYQGHTGSVNSIRFHPSRELALTSSGKNGQLLLSSFTLTAKNVNHAIFMHCQAITLLTSGRLL